MDVAAWIAALPELRERARGEPDLATARALVEEGQAMGALSEGHAALSHFVVASSILQRLVAEADSPDRNLADAYYLLGVTEARIGRNYWVTAAPFMLETAIRLAPDEPFAEDASSCKSSNGSPRHADPNHARPSAFEWSSWAASRQQAGLARPKRSRRASAG